MTEFDSEIATSFDALGQEIRIGTFEALVQKRVEAPQTPEASFSELRDRVGVTVSGRFNCHLDKLTGWSHHTASRPVASLRHAVSDRR